MEACLDVGVSSDKWLSRVTISSWLTHIKEILNCGCLVAQLLDKVFFLWLEIYLVERWTIFCVGEVLGGRSRIWRCGYHSVRDFFGPGDTGSGLQDRQGIRGAHPEGVDRRRTPVLVQDHEVRINFYTCSVWKYMHFGYILQYTKIHRWARFWAGGGDPAKFEGGRGVVPGRAERGEGVFSGPLGGLKKNSELRTLYNIT